MIYLIIPLLLLSGCHYTQINDIKINDRVKACSAGFSEEMQIALHASLHNINEGIDGSLQLHEDSKSMIFSQLQESDRIKAYEDYIKCIQKHWN
jgi:hypothetical protein